MWDPLIFNITGCHRSTCQQSNEFPPLNSKVPFTVPPFHGSAGLKNGRSISFVQYFFPYTATMPKKLFYKNTIKPNIILIHPILCRCCHNIVYSKCPSIKMLKTQLNINKHECAISSGSALSDLHFNFFYIITGVAL